ncbi:type II toxin-antitoxin system toxin ribonuclease C26 [soil metagenome]
MALILDSSGLLSAIDTGQRFHQTAREALENATGPLLLSPFVLAELDYMVLTRYGPDEESALLAEVSRGAYRLEAFSAEDVAEAKEVIEQYASFGDVGLADASNVVLARRYDTWDILTLDERHFRAMRGPQGRPFRLLPADH